MENALKDTSDVSKKEMETLLADLKTAVDGLKEVEAEEPQQPQKPEEPQQPEKPEVPQQKPQQPQQKPDNKVPETSDTANGFRIYVIGNYGRRSYCLCRNKKTT